MKGSRSRSFYQNNGPVLKAMVEEGTIEVPTQAERNAVMEGHQQARRMMPTDFNLINSAGALALPEGADEVDHLHLVLSQVGSSPGKGAVEGDHRGLKDMRELNNPESRDMGTDAASWRALVRSKDTYIGTLLGRTAMLVRKFTGEVSALTTQLTHANKEKKLLEEKNLSLMYYVEKTPQRAAEIAKRIQPTPPSSTTTPNKGGGGGPANTPTSRTPMKKGGGSTSTANACVTEPIAINSLSGGMLSPTAAAAIARIKAIGNAHDEHLEDFRREAFVGAITEQEEMINHLRRQLEDAQKKIEQDAHMYDLRALKHKITVGRLNKLRGTAAELQAQIDDPLCDALVRSVSLPVLESILDAVGSSDLDESRNSDRKVNEKLFRRKSTIQTDRLLHPPPHTGRGAQTSSVALSRRNTADMMDLLDEVEWEEEGGAPGFVPLPLPLPTPPTSLPSQRNSAVFITETELRDPQEQQNPARTPSKATRKQTKKKKKGGCALSHLSPAVLEEAYSQNQAVQREHRQSYSETSPPLPHHNSSLRELLSSVKMFRSNLKTLRADVEAMRSVIVLQAEGISTQVTQKVHRLSLLASFTPHLSQTTTAAGEGSFSHSPPPARSRANTLLMNSGSASAQMAVALSAGLGTKLDVGSSGSSHHQPIQVGGLELLDRALDVRRQSLLVAPSSRRASRGNVGLPSFFASGAGGGVGGVIGESIPLVSPLPVSPDQEEP